MLDIKGRVVVYGVAGCPHCLAAKKTLRDSGVPFIDVPLDHFPAVRAWLQEKTGKTSVPQIFFNETHVGGNDDLQRIVQNEEEWNKLLADVQDNEAKEDALVIPHPSEASDKKDIDPVFECEADPTGQVAEELKASGILHNQRLSLFSSTKNAFSGHEFVQWITKAKDINEEEALKIGMDLLDKKYITCLQGGVQISFLNDPKAHYSLNDSSESAALNAGTTQSCMLDNPGELAEALRKLILQLYSKHISDDGKMVNYSEMKNTEDFKQYVNLSRELQRAPVEKLDQDGRKAFFINVYNALVIHATAEKGSPSNWISRFKFFEKTFYIIGANQYSLNDIENGVLRGNKRGVAHLFAPFSKSDPRRKISLIQVDPRIHFALNCGAKSCPPIKTFSAENINKELSLATQAYLETDEALRVEEEQGVVHLSSLLRWYASDFGNTTEDVLQWVLRNMSLPEKKEALQRVLDTKKWKVTYIHYDWGSNSSH